MRRDRPVEALLRVVGPEPASWLELPALRRVVADEEVLDLVETPGAELVEVLERRLMGGSLRGADPAIAETSARPAARDSARAVRRSSCRYKRPLSIVRADRRRYTSRVLGSRPASW